MNKEIVTNPLRPDGLGAQFQEIIYVVIYADLTGKEFKYTPFTLMHHNYNEDPEYLNKKEHLINFIGNFEVNEDLTIQRQQHTWFFYQFFAKNMHQCINSNALKKIKKIFRSNKNNPSERSNLIISVHIRRCNRDDDPNFGTLNVPDSYYLTAIDYLRKLYIEKKPEFHIHSQGDPKDFEKTYHAPDIVLHINDSVEDAFTDMVFADILVTGTSSLSYTAGLLSDGEVYYIYSPPHPPLSHWKMFTFK